MLWHNMTRVMPSRYTETAKHALTKHKVFLINTQTSLIFSLPLGTERSRRPAALSGPDRQQLCLHHATYAAPLRCAVTQTLEAPI